MEVSRRDLAIASMAWGFTVGFGFLTTWAAMKQTALVHRRYGASRLNSPYIWMIWLEIAVSMILGIICWLHLVGVIPPKYELEKNFTSHRIIINRISILLRSRFKVRSLKYGIAAFITVVNISMYCTWIPGRLHKSKQWELVDRIWEYCEKVIYLIVDAYLNFYFMYIIQENLVRKGLVKYDRLLRFNKCIIGFSLSMDCLIIGIMSLCSSTVYVQFHPLAYMVKLNIEMAMTELMTKVSCEPNKSSHAGKPVTRSSFNQNSTKISFEESSSTHRQMYNHFHSTKEIVWRDKASLADLILDHCSDLRPVPHPECKFSLTREVHIQTEQRKSLQERRLSSESESDGTEQVVAAFEKLKKLRSKDIETDSFQSSRIIPGEEDLGSQTKIWGPSG